MRASLDDFKRPWNERHLYDRTSGEGFYRNVFDSEAACRLLLDPSGSTADGLVALCSIDPLTQVDHSAVKSLMPSNGVLVVDGVFVYGPTGTRTGISVCGSRSRLSSLSVRGTDGDAAMEGSAAEAETLHRDRYLVGEQLYVNEVNPRSFVEVIVDNTHFDRPRLLRPAD